MSGRIMVGVVSLIIEGLRRVAPNALPDDATLDALVADPSGVPLKPYREVLESVYERVGGAAILAAGRPLEELSDPILFVLLNSDRVELVIEKEARLARFIHSRHVVRIHEQSERGIRLEHASTVSDPPRLTENLASAGQHIVLLEQIGCRGLTLTLPESDAPDRAVYERGTYHEPSANACNVWQFDWDAFEPTRRPMPGLDEMLLSATPRTELREAETMVGSVEDIARLDLGRTWTLADVAARLDTSTRSLQRALASEGARFSEVLDALRVREATRLLAETTMTIIEIGYVCGFSDSSHFSRRFKARVGQTPSAYRASTST